MMLAGRLDARPPGLPGWISNRLEAAQAAMAQYPSYETYYREWKSAGQSLPTPFSNQMSTVNPAPGYDEMFAM
jgi:hypothetical protein